MRKYPLHGLLRLQDFVRRGLKNVIAQRGIENRNSGIFIPAEFFVICQMNLPLLFSSDKK